MGNLFTVRAAAGRYGVAYLLLDRAIKSGQLPVVTSGTRRYVNGATVERFLEGQAQPPRVDGEGRCAPLA